MSNESYERGLHELQILNQRLEATHFDYEKEMSIAITQCASNLDAYDFVYSITIGVLAAILDTNEKIADFFDEIHQLASMEKVESDNKFKELLGKLLHHQGDWMDKVPTDKAGKTAKSYVSRYAEQVAEGVWSSAGVNITGPHRIFWGHDIFSIKGDNPFTLLIKEYGVGRGVIQAIRHLVADTCSHQGLVLPGSSFFDYIDISDVAGVESATQKARNKLIDFCQQYSSEALGKKQRGFDNEVFNHLFSIHIQDVLSTGLVTTAIAVYCGGRKISDETRRVQMRVIGYMGAAFGSAIIGAAKCGIPYINWPAFFALTKNIIQMIHITNKEVHTIMIETERILIEGRQLRMREQTLHNELLADLYGTLTNQKANTARNALIDFLGEEN